MSKVTLPLLYIEFLPYPHLTLTSPGLDTILVPILPSPHPRVLSSPYLHLTLTFPSSYYHTILTLASAYLHLTLTFL